MKELYCKQNEKSYSGQLQVFRAETPDAEVRAVCCLQPKHDGEKFPVGAQIKLYLMFFTLDCHSIVLQVLHAGGHILEVGLHTGVALCPGEDSYTVHVLVLAGFFPPVQ